MKISRFNRSHISRSNESGVFVGDYAAFEHLYNGNPSDLTRAEARESFNNFMDHKNEQILRFKKLLLQNNLNLTGHSDDIRSINIWINENICESSEDFFVNDDGDKQFYIHSDWSNIIFDLSIFSSELVIQNTDNVSWHFNVNVPSNDISYQHPVLNGFSKAKFKNHYWSFGLSLFNYAREILDDPADKNEHFVNFIIEAAIIEDIDLENTMFDHSDFGEESGLM